MKLSKSLGAILRSLAISLSSVFKHNLMSFTFFFSKKGSKYQINNVSTKTEFSLHKSLFDIFHNVLVMKIFWGSLTFKGRYNARTKKKKKKKKKSQ